MNDPALFEALRSYAYEFAPRLSPLLQQAQVELKMDVMTWNSSDGFHHAHAATLGLTARALGQFHRSPSLVDEVHQQLAKAIPRHLGTLHSLAGLELRWRVYRREFSARQAYRASALVQQLSAPDPLDEVTLREALEDYIEGYLGQDVLLDGCSVECERPTVKLPLRVMIKLPPSVHAQHGGMLQRAFSVLYDEFRGAKLMFLKD